METFGQSNIALLGNWRGLEAANSRAGGPGPRPWGRTEHSGTLATARPNVSDPGSSSSPVVDWQV